MRTLSGAYAEHIVRILELIAQRAVRRSGLVGVGGRDLRDERADGVRLVDAPEVLRRSAHGRVVVGVDDAYLYHGRRHEGAVGGEHLQLVRRRHFTIQRLVHVNLAAGRANRELSSDVTARDVVGHVSVGAFVTIDGLHRYDDSAEQRVFTHMTLVDVDVELGRIIVVIHDVDVHAADVTPLYLLAAVTCNGVELVRRDALAI